MSSSVPGSPPDPSMASAPPPPDAAAEPQEPSIEAVSIPVTIVALEAAASDAASSPCDVTNNSAATNHNLAADNHTSVQLALDQDERALFQTLVQTAVAYEEGRIRLPPEENNNNDAPPGPASLSPSSSRRSPLAIRVAGGWVRDKLLRLQTHDVDIAVDTLSGVQFARLVQQHLSRQSIAYAGHKIGVIAANPAQSKHLETATMRVHDMDVDFCNLRAEDYHESSRIPNATTVGTPFEDAERRDFTMNALFYNLRTGAVEDWTGRGLRDLRQGLLVTPLCPRQTFCDDPLRVLRAVRFSVRYQFRLDPALQAAAMDAEIHRNLHLKVSRERVGKELEAMLSGKGADPVVGLDTLARLKLGGAVFDLPKAPGSPGIALVHGHILGQPYDGSDHEAMASIREAGWEESRRLLNLLPAVVDAQSVNSQGISNNATPGSTATAPLVDKRLLPLAVFLLPFRTLFYKEANKPDKEFLVVSWIFREGIKFKNKDVSAISMLLGATMDNMLRLLTELAVEGIDTLEHQRATVDVVKESSLVCRVDAGLLLREMQDLWLTSLLVATVWKTRQQQQGNDGVRERQVDWLKVSSAFYRSVFDLNLQDCWNMKPLMNGKQVIQELSLPRGPLVKTYLDEQTRWMLLNPTGSQEECKQHLLAVKRHLEAEEGAANGNESCLGMSDGQGKTPSSPVHDRQQEVRPHFSKKMHVESMDIG